MNAGVTFERVYLALREQLGAGRFAPGQHLEPAVLSHDLNASITPVRDALHRLAGEGLVDTVRGEGFRIPQLTEVGLRNLYRWNAVLLDLAAKSRVLGDPTPSEQILSEDSDLIGATERLFLSIGSRVGNPEAESAIARLNARLRPVRQIELQLLADAAAELEAIRQKAEEEAALPLRRSILAYHRRRERLVGEIVATLVAAR